MRTTRNKLKWTAAITLIAIGVQACPPALPPSQAKEDMKDYWPLRFGNYWEFEDRERPEYTFTVAVIENESTATHEAWELEFQFAQNGNVYSVGRTFLLWHSDKLVSLDDEKLLEEILNAPNDPLPDDPGLFTMMPRIFEQSDVPQEFDRPAVGGGMYTSTGAFAAAIYRVVCQQNQNLIQPAGYPIDPNTPSVVQMQERSCNNLPAIVGRTVFAKDIGPVDFQQSILIYAMVDGVEYVQ